MSKQNKVNSLQSQTPQFKVFGRYKNQHETKGRTFTKKSMTIPGQNVTPQEIIRNFTEGSKFREFYTNEPISNFDRMDKLQKIDYLTDLSGRNLQMKQEIDLKIAVLKQKQAIEDAKAAEQAMRDKVILEMQNKRDNSNDANK